MSTAAANMRTRVESNVSPFSMAVVSAMRRIYPEKLADNSFDNTGLLLEAPYRPGHLKNHALLTIDLTKAVADEAIRLRSSIIISYHPIIFRPLKSFTQSNTQQSTLLRLAQEGISVYSPHTAVDAVTGGINDWLCDIITGSNEENKRRHSRANINPTNEQVAGFEGAGYGRIVRYSKPCALGDIIHSITTRLRLKRVAVAVPQHLSHDNHKYAHPIRTVGVCAGSGGSLLNNLDVDLLFTGELSHHEALAAIEQGKCVITAFHSNTERGFLKIRMEHAIYRETKSAIEKMVNEKKWEEGLDTEFDISTSGEDRDPFETVSLEEGDWFGETGNHI